MPKLKTHKGMAKRIKLSATGKLLRRRAFRNHMLAHKQASTKREYVKEFEVSAGDTANIKKMLGTYKR
jgi:large subunit ribosomal protein L35